VSEKLIIKKGQW